MRAHFDCRPGALIRELNLLRPIYQKTAAYGHFGRADADFSWEQTNKADALKSAAKKLYPAGASASNGHTNGKVGKPVEAKPPPRHDRRRRARLIRSRPELRSLSRTFRSPLPSAGEG